MVILTILLSLFILVTIYQQYILYKIGKIIKTHGLLIDNLKELIIQNIKITKNNTSLINNMQNIIKSLLKKHKNK